jgi:hypothetical protein
LKIRIRRGLGASMAAYKLPTKVVLSDVADLYSSRLKKKRRA